MSIIWLGAIVVFTVLEAVSVQMISIWLAAAALLPLLLSLFGVPEWVQIIAFVLCVFVLLYFTRPIVRRLMKRPAARTNADRVLGMTAVVTMEINNEADTGQVKVRGQIWSARSLGGNPLPVGERVSVQSIEGVKLIVSSCADSVCSNKEDEKCHQ